jgi:peptidoglycan L-alanyl-D-glutamate endopeptidase CwlK
MTPDKITLTRIELLHPKLRAEAHLIYNDILKALNGKAICRFAYTLRTFEEQAEIYAQGRTKLFDKNGKRLGKVTNASPGSSFHQYGLAVDIVLIKDLNGDGIYETASWETTIDFDNDGKADWMEIVAIFKKYGWVWGGDWVKFKDRPHFEKTFNCNWRDLLKKHNAKDFILGTKYVNI